MREVDWPQYGLMLPPRTACQLRSRQDSSLLPTVLGTAEHKSSQSSNIVIRQSRAKGARTLQQEGGRSAEHGTCSFTDHFQALLLGNIAMGPPHITRNPPWGHNLHQTCTTHGNAGVVTGQFELGRLNESR